MRIAAAWALPALAWALTATAAPPPAEHFFRDASMAHSQLSPDGWKVAMTVASAGARARLAVLDLRTRQPKIVASFDDVDVGHFAWVNDQRLVLQMQTELIGPGRVEYAPGLFAVNADGSRFRQLVRSTGTAFVSQPGVGRELLHPHFDLLSTMPRQDGPEIFVARPEEVSRERIGHFELKRVNTETGLDRDVEIPRFSQHWVFAPDGSLRAAVARREDRQSLHLRRPDGSWAQVDERHWRDAGAVQPVHAAADGRLFGLAQHGDNRALFVLDPETGRPAREPMLESPDFDLAPHFISSRDGLLGVRYLVDGEATLWLDESMKALQQRIDQRLPGRVNRVDPPRHGDSPWMLVQSWSDRQPLMALVFHRETGEVLRLGSSHPEIEPRAMGRTELHRIPARDGLPLPAWLTLPADEAKGPRPMVLLVHGGPWVRGAQWRWDPEVQFLASRGYAVLEVEFRGSTGFGASHFEAGIGQWGQAMQTDLADAARWAIARGTADADRIAIMGASYGGYATLMGLVTDPGLYRCGVAWVGVTDPMLLFSVDWSDITGESKRYGLTTLIGDPVADAERLRRASPLLRAAEIKSPLMLAYGAWDLRVPLVHGEKMRDVLKSHGARHEWVVYDNEGHGWSRAENRVNFWTRVEAFLARELAPR